MLLDPLKCKLKDLVSQARYDEVFALLKDDLRRSCLLSDDVILLSSRYVEAQRAGNLNTIDFREKNLSFSNVAQALLWVINRIETEDLNDRLRQDAAEHVTLPNFHAFGCDRFNQKESFEEALLDHADQKFHLFYLCGDTRQEHISLFEWLAYNQGGFLENWEKGQYNSGIQVKMRKLKPESRRHPVLFYKNVVRALMASCFPQLDDQAPLENRTLNDLLAEGSELHSCRKQDMVFLLLTMDAADWNKETVPIMLDYFYQHFLSVVLPAAAPTFFFFFGVEYEAGQAAQKAEVQDAIISRRHGGEALQPLEPVAASDITKWFNRYSTFMVKPGQTADSMRRSFFGDDAHRDMLDIQYTLLQLIELHNKGLVIQAENLR